MAIMSIYSLTIMISKWWNLREAQKETLKFAPEFSQFLEEDNLTEAIRLAESYKKSHVALVLGGALGEIKPLIAGRLGHGRRHQLGGARGRAQHAHRDHATSSAAWRCSRRSAPRRRSSDCSARRWVS